MRHEPRWSSTYPQGGYTHVADGLHDGDEPDPSRAALQEFIGEIVSLTESVEGGEAFYSPTRVAIVAAPIGTTPGGVVKVFPCRDHPDRLSSAAELHSIVVSLRREA